MNLKSARLFVLIVVEYLKRNLLLFTGALTAVLILFFLQTKFGLFYSSNSLRIGLIGTFQEHDLPLFVTHLASGGLVQSNSDGKIRPNLVTGWEVNNNATSFKFKLKDNLKWIDNTPIKSSDLEFVIPNTTISYPDGKTVLFTLKEAYSPLPSLLIKPIFKKGSLLGSGP